MERSTRAIINFIDSLWANAKQLSKNTNDATPVKPPKISKHLNKVCSHIMAPLDLLCGLHKVCSHIMAPLDLLCGLHKVCSHIMAPLDLFIYLSTKSSASHVVTHTCTHCGSIF